MLRNIRYIVQKVIANYHIPMKYCKDIIIIIYRLYIVYIQYGPTPNIFYTENNMLYLVHVPIDLKPTDQ